MESISTVVGRLGRGFGQFRGKIRMQKVRMGLMETDSRSLRSVTKRAICEASRGLVGDVEDDWRGGGGDKEDARDERLALCCEMRRWCCWICKEGP